MSDQGPGAAHHGARGIAELDRAMTSIARVLALIGQIHDAVHEGAASDEVRAEVHRLCKAALSETRWVVRRER